MRKEKQPKVKKPIYKKWWFWVIVVFVVIGAIGSNGNNEAPKATESAKIESAAVPAKVEATTEPEDEHVELTEKEQIEQILTDRIVEEYTFTEVDHITINDDLGTDKEGDYIALVYLNWNQKNSGKTSKEMLTMYSSDLAATLANENDTVNEIAIFWTVPYLNDNAKCSYQRSGDSFAVMDMMWGKAFN